MKIDATRKALIQKIATIGDGKLGNQPEPEQVLILNKGKKTAPIEKKIVRRVTSLKTA